MIPKYWVNASYLKITWFVGIEGILMPLLPLWLPSSCHLLFYLYIIELYLNHSIFLILSFDIPKIAMFLNGMLLFEHAKSLNWAVYLNPSRTSAKLPSPAPFSTLSLPSELKIKVLGPRYWPYRLLIRKSTLMLLFCLFPDLPVFLWILLEKMNIVLFIN